MEAMCPDGGDGLWREEEEEEQKLKQMGEEVSGEDGSGRPEDWEVKRRRWEQSWGMREW